MATVVKFPKPPRRELPELNVGRIEAAPRRGSFERVLAIAWLMVRLPLFLLLYWLRLPVVLVCELVWIPTLLAFLFACYAFPDKTPMIWTLGTLSFAAFVVRVAYDFVLMALSPWDTPDRP
jgi:hypothetical protein